MNKTDIILKLVRENMITDEEAKVLLATEKEYVYYPINYPYWSTANITYGTGYAATNGTPASFTSTN